MGSYRNPRPCKGKSLLKALDDYTAVDIETTGLSPYYCDIIEIGAVRFRSGKAQEEFEMLIDPGYRLPREIVTLTGITDAMLRSAPTLSEVLPAFREFLGEDIVLGHNVHFDINFLYDKSVALGLEPLRNNFVDTMRLSRKFYPQYSHHRLGDLMDRFGIVRDEAHRGLADSYSAAACYEYMKKTCSWEK